MEVTVKFDITDCTDCPFLYNHRGHGECWAECNHKDHGQKPYETILWGCQEEFKSVPAWCPIGLNK